MFADTARIFVRGGAGGDGSTSFRREAHVPKGGPDGGDGGRGGDVVLVCDPSRRDLGAFRRGAHFRAKRGGHGEGSQRHGATAAVLEVPVPPGTVAEGWVGSDQEAHWDLTQPGQRATVARGGPGGKGNKRFAGSTR
ncbi:MAG: GTPase ObgE, partial [Thermoleophilaceae bacterium]|nr:GTPase ObgE [Thermoleophilaceae bacterium]